MKIALLAGDGIGPEILREAVKVLDVLRRDGLPIETEEALVGGAAYDAHKDPLPEATLRLARQADAVLFGAVGSPAHDKLPRDKRPERAILGLRKECDFFANLRPATVFPELADASSLKPEIVSGLEEGDELVIVTAAQLQAQQDAFLQQMRGRMSGQNPFGGGVAVPGRGGGGFRGGGSR